MPSAISSPTCERCDMGEVFHPCPECGRPLCFDCFSEETANLDCAVTQCGACGGATDPDFDTEFIHRRCD